MAAFVPEDTVVKDAAGNAVKASSLWSGNQPVLVVILRRPGCLLCRDQAISIWNSRDTLHQVCSGSSDEQGGQERKGPVRLVCVLHEWKEREVEAFTKDYWHGELYYDESKAFYKSIHGGVLKKGSLASFLNPFSKAWKHIRDANKRGIVKDHNMEGDGLTLGGLAVLDCPKGNAVFTFEEQTFGDRAPMEDIVRAVHSLYTTSATPASAEGR